MKAIAKVLAGVLGGLWGLAPFALRRTVLRAFLLLESRAGEPASALKHLFLLADDVDRLLAERATVYGGGVNPKHRLTRYHEFFTSRIADGARVLDVGCGIGAVARSIAKALPASLVTGVDNDPRILKAAREFANPANLTFVEGDALDGAITGAWDAIVLSNVLEHLDHRSAFLRTLGERTGAKQFLLRVPLFERHWHMPLRKELGVDFRSDPTHFIEHTLSEFEAELAEAGLEIKERQTLWGEIWAVAEPKS